MEACFGRIWFLHFAYLEPEEKVSLSTDKLPEQSSLPNAAVSAVPTRLGSRNGAPDADGADPIFSLGKSPARNGTSVSERIQGAGGLGDGTPKVSEQFFYFF